MRFAPRRLAVTALVAGGLTLLSVPAAHAVVDPVLTLTCLAEAPNAALGVIDPAAAMDPASLLAMPELPATNCLAP
ncbi:hypothetical protein AB0M50_24145 [Nonomuraea fuscirosea]|jgi:hypothetical protein|uniref:hypothetical protein n=1 Tax=Nonomuraea fuscirosea TaxID=1291556 RepID=UPI002DDBACDA|nr:hypothetical protein [Nonomuraea fuscirosea]WSA55115.1 hypothetical protein OIE67_11045 [Nonomuraea fuscirosea]